MIVLTTVIHGYPAVAKVIVDLNAPGNIVTRDVCKISRRLHCLYPTLRLLSYLPHSLDVSVMWGSVPLRSPRSIGASKYSSVTMTGAVPFCPSIASAADGLTEV